MRGPWQKSATPSAVSVGSPPPVGSPWQRRSAHPIPEPVSPPQRNRSAHLSSIGRPASTAPIGPTSAASGDPPGRRRAAAARRAFWFAGVREG
ncbi:hypothetical protein STRIP9103_02293, partial [Streptomyces ipomoeae 91-03]